MTNMAFTSLLFIYILTSCAISTSAFFAEHKPSVIVSKIVIINLLVYLISTMYYNTIKTDFYNKINKILKIYLRIFFIYYNIV